MQDLANIISGVRKHNGIKFHGKISYDEVIEVMGSSMAVIHTESFDESVRKSVAYSISTKIADSLASGTYILAFGPEEIASIEYLKENEAAFCIVDDENLEKDLVTFFNIIQNGDIIARNAIILAKKNHVV